MSQRSMQDQETRRPDDESEDDSSDEGHRALTNYFRAEVRQQRAAREQKWVSQTRFRSSDISSAGSIRQSVIGAEILPRKDVNGDPYDIEAGSSAENTLSDSPAPQPVVGEPDLECIASLRYASEQERDGESEQHRHRHRFYEDDRVEEKIVYSDMEEEVEEKFILRPDQRWRRTWDIYMLFLLLYVATISVFIFSFVGVLDYSNPFFWTERFVDVSFAIDIVLNFFTAFELVGVLVTDRTKIAKHYLSTWFIPDVLSTIPWGLIAKIVNPSISGPSIWQVPRYLRLLRVFKLMRLARVLRLKRVVTYLEIKFKLKYAYVRSITLVFIVVLISHWFACLFYFFGAISAVLGGNWIRETSIPKDLYGQYIAALYFSVYTITTIGYGDVTPTNTVERTYTTIIMFCGAACFAFIISQVSNLAGELSSSSQSHRERMDTLMDLATYRNLEPKLVFQIRRYFQRDFLRQRVVNEEDILAKMSPDLRIRVLKSIYSEKVQESRLLSQIKEDNLDDVYIQMKGIFHRPNETIYNMHDKSDFMYIIVKGEVTVDDMREGRKTKTAGGVFGENELLFDQRRRGRAQCKTYCELVEVPRSAVMRVLERHRHVLRELRREEALQLWAEAIGTAEQQVRYWKMAGQLRHRAVNLAIREGRGEALRERLNRISERTGWNFDIPALADGTSSPSVISRADSSLAARVILPAENRDSGSRDSNQASSPTSQVDIPTKEILDKIVGYLESLSGRISRIEDQICNIAEREHSQ